MNTIVARLAIIPKICKNNSGWLKNFIAKIFIKKYKNDVYPSNGGSFIFQVKPCPFTALSAILRKIYESSTNVVSFKQRRIIIAARNTAPKHMAIMYFDFKFIKTSFYQFLNQR